MKTIGIILGRFQPPTQAHFKLIERAGNSNNEVYIFVAGNIKSKNNPLPFDVRSKIIKKFNWKNNIIVTSVKHGFIPDLIKEYIQSDHYNDVKFRVYCGDDRHIDYDRQMKTRFTDIQYSIISIKRSVNNISSTTCRQFLREDNYHGFRSMYPNFANSFCEELYHVYREYINE
jgi:cytidyltransferase-like protein